MGWSSDFLGYWNGKDTNKNLFLRAYPSYGRMAEEGKIKVSQKGSDIFVLYKCDVKGDYFGKWWVTCFLCRREKGHEFFTKDIDAIDNLCFGFPKSWVALLDKDNEMVKKYIEAREEAEAKTKAKGKIEIGDWVEAVAPYEITWNSGHSIAEGEKFHLYVKVLNPYAKKKQKSYVVAQPGMVWRNGACEWEMNLTNRRISNSTFKNLKSVRKMTAEEIDAVVSERKSQMAKEAV